MIVTTVVGNTNTFENILFLSKNDLLKKSSLNRNRFLSLNPSDLEIEVYTSIINQSKDTVFENNIELKSGHAFPDIVSSLPFGVEVKSKKSDSWKTTGNSVLESTRVENIDRIYFFYGKLASPIDFRYRLYQDCIYDVTVTHSPRYKIDMDLESGSTFFNKINIPYDELRNFENPILPIIDYFRENSSPGEYTWWMGDEPQSDFVKPTVTLLSNLNLDEKDYLIAYGYALFPEILGSSTRKYDRFASWLAANHGVISSHLRDFFSAGRNEDFLVGEIIFEKLSKTYIRMVNKFPIIMNIIKNLSYNEIKDGWRCNSNIQKENRLDAWRRIVIDSAYESFDDIDIFLDELFRKYLEND